MMFSTREDSVMATNDDATTCKVSAVRLKYWTDPYIEHLVRISHVRKTPEINRGYYSRVAAIWQLVNDFLRATDGQGQIVNLGAGFDTLFFRLKAANVPFSSVVEVDQSGVTSRKVRAITRSQPLLQEVQGDVQYSNNELHSDNYHIISGDLRQIRQLGNKMLTECSLNVHSPTLFLAECVLVYINVNESDTLLTWIAEHFKNCLFINYEQVNMGDQFGVIMTDNLRARNCDLMGADACIDLDTQMDRFTRTGWHNAKGWDMWQIYSLLPQDEIYRIEKIEFLDEKELLEQLLRHYCIIVAYKLTEFETLKSIGFE